MYELTVKTSFNAAHNLRNYKRKCEQLHGHNWKVEVGIRGEKLNKTGMLVDFKEIKEATSQILEKIDHTYLNRISPFTRINPSSENIAKYLYEQLKTHRLFHIKKTASSYRLYKVSVWETDTTCATYTEEYKINESKQKSQRKNKW